MSTDKQVDFLCIGAAKAGTTWLHDMLSQHPGVARAKAKEINYFNPQHPEYADRPNPDAERAIDWYHAQFEGSAPAMLWGDYATAYLRYPASAARVKAYRPDMKLIVLLRNPVERAISHHHFLYQWGVVPQEDFMAAAQSHENILQSGMYAEQLAGWMEHFPTEQFLILDYARIAENPAALWEEVLAFLGLPSFALPSQDERSNASAGVKSKRLHRSIQWLRGGWQAVPGRAGMSRLLTRLGARRLLHRVYAANSGSGQSLPPISPATRDWLHTYYLPDQQTLRDLIGWNHLG